MKPLEGLLVLDMSIFLAGPLCALRLGDLGARVIKIERPDGGDLCRQLYICDTQIDGESMLFHAINRNKQSFAADFRNPADLQRVRKLIARADVLIANFRPGVMEKFALDYPSVRQINPGIVYGSISGSVQLRTSASKSHRRTPKKRSESSSTNSSGICHDERGLGGIG